MDLTKLAAIAKFKVGDTVLHMRHPHRVIGRYWSISRKHIVYDVERTDDDRRSVMRRIGEGLIEPMPPSGAPQNYYDDLPGDW